VKPYVHGYGTPEQERLVEQAEHWRHRLITDGTQLQPGTRLLEVGCGVGAVLAVLGQEFPGVRLVGVDIEPKQLDFAREHLARAGVEATLREADALELPFGDESFDHAAESRGRDVVVVDTAGRLHTQANLMEELSKVRRVIGQRLEDAPHETLLVVDATTGQNGLQQARLFGQAVDVTGIALTKLDGSAKGGIAIAIAHELGLPVKLIGIGEGIDDLRPFDPKDSARALVGEA
jgi:SAM-dependent methyltransferase